MGLEEFELIGESPPMQDLERVLRRVAPTDAIVLTHGESGTGKELVARAIHQLGVDPKRPFVTVECTNIPATLMESELFGHEAGASTAARTRKQVTEGAAGGTLFLDEIALLPNPLQAKLLHVLEMRGFRRLGGNQEISVEVRFLAATNEDLGHAVDEGRFREDLYHRLAVVRIEVPPLRERARDVHHIAATVVEEYNQRHRTGSRRELAELNETAVTATDGSVSIGGDDAVIRLCRIQSASWRRADRVPHRLRPGRGWQRHGARHQRQRS